MVTGQDGKPSLIEILKSQSRLRTISSHRVYDEIDFKTKKICVTVKS